MIYWVMKFIIYLSTKSVQLHIGTCRWCAVVCIVLIVLEKLLARKVVEFYMMFETMYVLRYLFAQISGMVLLRMYLPSIQSNWKVKSWPLPVQSWAKTWKPRLYWIDELIKTVTTRLIFAYLHKVEVFNKHEDYPEFLLEFPWNLKEVYLTVVPKYYGVDYKAHPVAN